MSCTEASRLLSAGGLIAKIFKEYATENEDI